MQDLIANVSNMGFEVEDFLESQIGCISLPFIGMDKSGAAICNSFKYTGLCNLGQLCPFRHIKGDKNVVCKHWLRGLCKKGDDCEFLHEYDMSKMPECYFYSKFNACNNKECPFLHIDPESKIKECPWYFRGFCRHGPSCKNRHVRRVICICYLNGFCPDGPSCKFIHPKFDAPTLNEVPQIGNLPLKRTITCHYCGELGHKLQFCSKLQNDSNTNATSHSQLSQAPFIHIPLPSYQLTKNFGGTKVSDPGHRNMDNITCFRCGERGHFANRCPRIPTHSYQNEEVAHLTSAHSNQLSQNTYSANTLLT